MKSIYAKHEEENIIITKAASKKAGIIGSNEYKAMRKLKHDYPDYGVVIKEIKKNPNKKSYANLTYENMKLYIGQTEGADAENLKRFKSLTEAAKIQSSPYAYVKKWFLINYPDYQDQKKGSEKETNDTPHNTTA